MVEKILKIGKGLEVVLEGNPILVKRRNEIGKSVVVKYGEARSTDYDCDDGCDNCDSTCDCDERYFLE